MLRIFVHLRPLERIIRMSTFAYKMGFFFTLPRQRTKFKFTMRSDSETIIRLKHCIKIYLGKSLTRSSDAHLFLSSTWRNKWTSVCPVYAVILYYDANFPLSFFCILETYTEVYEKKKTIPLRQIATK